MKAWTVSELDNIAASIGALVGARLQEVQTSDDDLVLGFYSTGRMLWLWVDLNAVRPCLLPWTDLPLSVPARKNPLHLFLRAHFDGKVLREVKATRAQRSCGDFGFWRSRTRAEAFSSCRNVIARAGEKQIAWQKPKDLNETLQETNEAFVPRSLETLREQWLLLREVRGGLRPRKTYVDVLSPRLLKRGRLSLRLTKSSHASAMFLETGR